ncbi:MAG: hypothetical protein WBL28_07305 [Methylotenera sp.]
MGTVAQTVIAGLLIFVAGQIFLKLVIEPVHQLKKTLADISHTFVRYAHRIHNPDVISQDDLKEIFEKLRELSGRLYEDMALIPLYCVEGKIFFLPHKDKIYSAATNLIAIANWMHSKNDHKFDHIVKNIQTACDNLGLYIDPKDRIPDEHLQLP